MVLYYLKTSHPPIYHPPYYQYPEHPEYTALSTYAPNTQPTAQQMFKQNWYEELNRQSKLSFYRTVKTEF